MNAGVNEGDESAVIARQQRKNIARIVKAASGKDLQPQVVPLFQGAKQHLYVYRVWNDIRLVCSPHLQTAHFGGDPDNFTYPRFGIDFAFCRAYVDGKPADTSKHYFKWKMGGAKKGEMVIVPGNPGSTGRLLTKAQLEYTRDVRQPIVLDFLDAQVAVRNEIADRDAEYEKKTRPTRFSMQNSQKAYRGYQAGVMEEKLMAAKAQNEKDFRERVETNPELKAKYGDVWERIAAIADEQRQVYPEVWFLNRDTRLNSPELTRALRFVAGQKVDWSKPLPKDPADDGLAALMLASAKRWLGDDHPVIKELLGDLSPTDAVKRLRSSKVGSADMAAELEKNGADDTQDPAIRAAPPDHQAQERGDGEVEPLAEPARRARPAYRQGTLRRLRHHGQPRRDPDAPDSPTAS